MSRRRRRPASRLNKAPAMTPGAALSPINPHSGRTGAPGSFSVPPGARPQGRGSPQRPSAGGSRYSTQPTGYNPQDVTSSRYPQGALPLGPSQYADVREEQPPNYISDVDVSRNWFSPFQPVWPFGPPYVNFPRNWDYQTGVNLAFNNRRGDLYTFLRLLADSGEGLLRTVIESRKDELIHMPWRFQRRDDAKKKDKRLDFLNEFFEEPDGVHDFDTWSRMLLEDMFVIDAATVHCWKRKDGTPYRAEIIDGSMIHVLVDDAGRVPDPPNPAYQQIVSGGGGANRGAGLPMINLTREELIYAPRNPRPYLPVYGLSPVEQIYLRATEMVRQEVYVLGIWDEGTIPDLVLACPDQWTPQQISEFQVFFDTLLAGQLGMKSRARFVPGGMKPVLSKGTTGEILTSLEKREERLARIICFAFSISPASFVSMMNRGTAVSLSEEASQEGLFPLMAWRESVMNRMLWHWWKWRDLEFVHLPEPNVDPVKRAQVHGVYVDKGIMARNEVREQLDLPPVDGGDIITIAQGNTSLPLAAVITATAPPKAPGNGAQANGGAPGAQQQRAKKPAGGGDSRGGQLVSSGKEQQGANGANGRNGSNGTAGNANGNGKKKPDKLKKDFEAQVIADYWLKKKLRGEPTGFSRSWNTY